MNNDVSPAVGIAVVNAMDIKRSLMRIDPDKGILKEFTEQELVKNVKAFDYILDTCDGLFSANQEMMMHDMREKIKEELEERE